MDPKRLKTVSLTIILFYFVALSRLFYWQIIKYSELRPHIIDQTYKSSVIKPSRGLIFDRDLYPLVLNKSVYTLSLYKPELKTDPKDIEKFALESDEVDESDKLQIQKFFQNDNQKWLALKSRFNRETAQKFSDPGMIFKKVEERFHPENDLGRIFLGDSIIDTEGNIKPLGGLESYYHRQLKGRSGFSWETRDATGQTLLSRAGWQIDSLNGRDIVTSISRETQYFVEKVLRDGIEKYSADSGSITIMDPVSGAIIAMSSQTASPSAVSTAAFSRNPVTSDLFEPGSIFKPLVMSMALDSKMVGTDYVCTKCNRPHQIGEYSISNWDSSFHADTPLKDIIKNSDNIGMSYIIGHLGLNRFLSYFDNLGLNNRTGIDLQAEAKPVKKEYWPEIDLATASFGQGFAITQIQMLTAFNTLANNGQLVSPRIAKYFIENGSVVTPSTPPVKKIFEPGTVNTMRNILKYSVENGVVNRFRPDNIEVCAKSGTSEVAVKGGYSESSTIASYVGFSPCENPKFTMIVTINNPRTSPWGSSTAAPIWYEIASFLSSQP